MANRDMKEDLDNQICKNCQCKIGVPSEQPWMYWPNVNNLLPKNKPDFLQR